MLRGVNNFLIIVAAISQGIKSNFEWLWLLECEDEYNRLAVTRESVSSAAKQTVAPEDSSHYVVFRKKTVNNDTQHSNTDQVLSSQYSVYWPATFMHCFQSTHRAQVRNLNTIQKRQTLPITKMQQWQFRSNYRMQRHWMVFAQK